PSSIMQLKRTCLSPAPSVRSNRDGSRSCWCAGSSRRWSDGDSQAIGRTPRNEGEALVQLWRVSCRLRRRRPVVIEHEQTNCRRQIALPTAAVDLADQLGQRLATLTGNLLHAAPEWLFQADAGFVARNHNRAFDHLRFHFCTLLAQKSSDDQYYGIPNHSSARKRPAVIDLSQKANLFEPCVSVSRIGIAASMPQCPYTLVGLSSPLPF